MLILAEYTSGVCRVNGCCDTTTCTPHLYTMSGFSLFRRTKKRRLGGHDARVGGDSGDSGAAATAKSSSVKTARLARKRQRVTAAANGAGGGAGAEEEEDEEEVAAQGDSATSSSDSGSDDSDASDSDDSSSSSNSGDSDAEEANNFNELGIAQWLVDACSGMDIVVPTPVQSACIPEVLKGRDVLGCSPTGSGKVSSTGNTLATVPTPPR